GVGLASRRRDVDEPVFASERRTARKRGEERAGNALVTLRAGLTGSAGGARRTGRARGAGVALRTLWASQAALARERLPRRPRQVLRLDRAVLDLRAGD